MISVTILVKNGERHIHSVLQSLKKFDEVLLFDTGSTDQTLDIARQFPNTTIYQDTFESFGKAHNRAAALAKHDWILSIDADEILTHSLADEILNLNLDEKNVYSLPFINLYRNKRVHIWDGEKHVRLYNRKKSQFSEALVHEAVSTEGLEIVYLKHFVEHHSYGSISDFLVKMERYSSLFAEQHKGRSVSFWTAYFHGMAAFWKNYLLKRGFLDGYRGFLIALYMSHTAFYKYMKLYEAQC